MTSFPTTFPIVLNLQPRMSSISFEWKAIASLIAIAFAVASLCLSIFSGCGWIAIGFGLLAASTIKEKI